MSEIRYQNSLENVDASRLEGFFVGWPKKPSPSKHYELLEKSDYITIAIHEGRVIGFVTAISDGVLSAYIPLLEVLPEYRNAGVGKALTEKMLAQLSGHYMVDLLCDEELQSYYEQFGMSTSQGMCIRNYEHQSGMLVDTLRA